MKIEFKKIGTIHSQYKNIEGMPIQPAGAAESEGYIELLPELSEGLDDLDGFSHLILIYHFHQSKGYSLKVKPFLDRVKRGVFSTRAPKRPNPIGLSIVTIIHVKDNIINIGNVDILDGTPLLDMKPYVPEFDAHNKVKAGWLDQVTGRVKTMKSDDRFGNEQ